MSNMFPEESMIIQYNNINSVIHNKNVEFNTSSDHGLCNIKCEFDEEETKIEFGVMENQLLEEKVNDKLAISITKLHDDEDGEIAGSFQKNQSTISDKVSQEDIKIEPGECKSDITEESDTSWDYELSNIKCEFEEEETKIEFGVMENQLLEEEVKNKFSLSITKLHDDEEGEIPGSFQKNQLTIIDKGYQEGVKIEPVECESDISEDSETSLDYELSNIKCEFDEEETKIQYGIHEDQLNEEKITKNSTDITTLQIFDGVNSDKNEPTGEKPTKCEICSKCFRKNGLLKRHMMIHTGAKPHKCEICGKCFAMKYQLNEHMRTHSREEPLQCEICSKCFSKKRNLKIHMMIHTGEKPHKCEICSKSFIENVDLKRHIMIHTGEKPHKCEFCGKCFIRKQHLNEHMRTHTGEKPHKCEICSKCFSLSGCLKKHMRIHTGEKPHKCEICSKCFSGREVLKKHIRTHTGEKPYKCEVCSKCFCERGVLKKHMMIHTGEKPHKCEICGKCFTMKHHLNQHMRTHTKEKPHKC